MLTLGGIVKESSRASGLLALEQMVKMRQLYAFEAIAEIAVDSNESPWPRDHRRLEAKRI